MEEIKGEDIKSAKDEQLTIILPPPPNKNHEEKVSYGVFNGTTQRNFTTHHYSIPFIFCSDREVSATTYCVASNEVESVYFLFY